VKSQAGEVVVNSQIYHLSSQARQVSVSICANGRVQVETWAGKVLGVVVKETWEIVYKIIHVWVPMCIFLRIESLDFMGFFKMIWVPKKAKNYYSGSGYYWRAWGLHKYYSLIPGGLDSSSVDIASQSRSLIREELHRTTCCLSWSWSTTPTTTPASENTPSGFYDAAGSVSANLS
jgi:hypothetical protein